VVKAVAVAILSRISYLQTDIFRKTYTVAGVTVFLKKEEQSCEADAGPGFALLAITALRQLSRAQVGLIDCAAVNNATAGRRRKERILSELKLRILKVRLVATEQCRRFDDGAYILIIESNASIGLKHQP